MPNHRYRKGGLYGGGSSRCQSVCDIGQQELPLAYFVQRLAICVMPLMYLLEVLVDFIEAMFKWILKSGESDRR